MGEYTYRSATELARLIRNGTATSMEIVTEHLARIKQYNPELNAVVISLEDNALKSAAECDNEAKLGKFRGPLHGVPMTVKEQFWIKDTKSTVNFKLFRDWVAPEDAIVVSRLKKAGAVILGKTNVPKNLTDYQVDGDLYLTGKNPYNTAYSPGGSSGGASASLASGMAPVELGGDFGGSIRIPSNYCGLYGMKPTENTVPGHGSVPKPKGAKGYVFHMATAGPMARTIDDLELVWKIIRGTHTSERNLARIEWKDASEKTLSDYRVAWVDGWDHYPVSTTIQFAIKNFVQELENRGSKVKHAGPGNNLHERSLSLFVRLFAQLISQDVPWPFRLLMKRDLRNNLLKGMDRYTRELNKGFKHSFLNYSETMGIRAGITGEWGNYFKDHDLLVCPMSFGPAFKRCKIGTPISYEGKQLIYADYAWPYVACFNASGHPAINLPLGIGREGLPVGVQVVGPYWSEPDLIQFAKLAAEFTPGFVKPAGY